MNLDARDLVDVCEEYGRRITAYERMVAQAQRETAYVRGEVTACKLLLRDMGREYVTPADMKARMEEAGYGELS